MTIKDSCIFCNWSYLIPAFDRMAVTGGNMAWSQGTMNANKAVNCENIQALNIKAGNDRPKILSGKFQSPVASLQLYKEKSQHSNRKQFPKHLQSGYYFSGKRQAWQEVWTTAFRSKCFGLFLSPLQVVEFCLRNQRTNSSQAEISQKYSKMTMHSTSFDSKLQRHVLWLYVTSPTTTASRQ